MASWTQTFSVNNKYSLTLTCTEQSYSVPNNSSVVAYSLTMATAANSFTGYSDYRTTVSISINGSTVYTYNAARDFNPSALSSYSEVLKSGTTTVSHNSDGTKVCACAASVTVASGDYSPGSASISKNLTLTTIPRASSVSASGQYIGSAVTITISRASSSFTHDLTYSFAGHTGTIATGVATSYSWTPALATFGAYIPNTTSGTCTITCTTKNGSTTIGTSTTSLTLYLRDTVKPSGATGWQTPSYVNSGGASAFNVFVQGYSKLKITFDSSKITYQGGASFSKYRLTVGGKSYDSTSSTVTSDTLTSSGNISYTVSVYDSRNRYYSATGTITVYAYAQPSISSSTVFRSDSSGTASTSGAYASVKATANVSSVNNLNSYTLRTRYQESGGSWSGWTTLTSGTASVIAGNMVANKTYIVGIQLTDTMGNTATTQATIPTESVTFNALEGGNGFAFGKYAETENLLDLADDWLLHIGGGIDAVATNDVIADANAQENNTIKMYRCAYSTYTGTLPSGFKYGYFIVFKRSIGSSIPNGGTIVAINYESRIAICSNTYGTWGNWNFQSFKTVTKDATVSFSAGTIGTRGFATEWSSSSVGGTPDHVEIAYVSGSTSVIPIAWVENNTVYLRCYRAVSTAVSNLTVRVKIYYT